MESNKVKFRKKIINMGDSLGNTIPKELIEYLGLKPKDGIEMIPEKNKKGQKFVAFWKEE